jgi:hypothetical protein
MTTRKISTKSKIVLISFILITGVVLLRVAQNHSDLQQNQGVVEGIRTESNKATSKIDEQSQNTSINLPTTQDSPVTSVHQTNNVKETATAPQDTPFINGTVTQTDYKKVPTGTMWTFPINTQSMDIQLLDFSQYDTQVFVFRWNKGQFLYGLSNETKVPDLSSVLPGDENDQTDTMFTSDLLSFSGKKYLFIKPENQVEGLTLYLVSPSNENGQLLAASNYNSGIKYSGLHIIPREEWSGDPNINDPRLREDGGKLIWYPYYYKTTKFIIHHTATANNEDPIYWMRSIYTFHSLSFPNPAPMPPGLGDIGYNYLIDQYGNIYEGKLGGDEAKGYHAGTEGNRNSIAIAFIGTFSNVLPTQAAQDSLAKLIAEKSVINNVTPGWGSTVYGHRDFIATGCPGNTLYAQLPQITSLAATYMNTQFSALAQVILQVNADFDNTVYKPNELILIFYNEPTVDTLRTMMPFLFDSGTNSYLPVIWTGIQSYEIQGKIVKLDVDYTSGGTESTVDRIRMMYKVFKMNPAIQYVTLNHRGELL